MADLSTEAIDEILELVARRQGAMIRNLIPSLHPADVADLLDAVSSDDRAYLFDLLEPEMRSDVLVELDERNRRELVEEMAPGEISDLVARLESDDAADIVGELDEPVQDAVLESLEEEEAEELRTLLAYPADSAGGIMASEFMALPRTTRVEEAIEAIRDRATEIPDPHSVYVQDPEAPLQGAVSLRSLLLAPRGVILDTLMAAPDLTVPPELDQEDVARLVRQYDALEVPVVDGQGSMIGIITVDDVVDVIEEEAEEDIGRMAGTGDERVGAASVLHATGRRLPWLLIGLAGGLLAAVALSRFELTLREIVSLAFFVPVINAMGGNVAMQSSSIAVRGLALGAGAYRAMGRQVLKEFLVSVLNGLVCGLIMAGVVMLWLREGWLALLIGGSLACVILISTTVGALVPILFDRAKIDPALATGPFVTTANDVLGILVYLSMAEIIIPKVR